MALIRRLVIVLFTVASMLSMSMPVQAQAVDDIQLGPGDVLKMRFQGRESLDGEYVIGTEGELFFPGIGAVQATGRTVRQVSSDLDALMRKTLGLAERTFSINVFEFRPIYVGGRVQQPGIYPYRPGLRVAHAVAMAGGVKTSSSSEPTLALETGREYARLRVAEDQLASALLRRRILMAELGMPLETAAAEATPEMLANLAGHEEATFRASLQAALVMLQNDVDRIEKTVLEQRAASAQGEVGALDSQLDALRAILKISSEELDILTNTVEKGLIPRPRILELQRLIASTNGEISATLARRYGAESNQRAFSGDASLIDESRRLHNLLELSLATAEISALRRQIEATRTTLSDLGSLPNTGPASCGIELWRTTLSDLQIAPVDQTMALLPGDFVRMVEKSADGSCAQQKP